jgi:hypothetical protein
MTNSKNPKFLLNNYGYKKYIEINGSAIISINLEKVKNDARWDGLLGVVTNLDRTEPE